MNLTEGNSDFKVSSKFRQSVIFRDIDLHKPTAPCAIPPWVYSDPKVLLVQHLTFIFKECMQQSRFPTEPKRVARL